MNPADWGSIQRERASGDGQYVLGSARDRDRVWLEVAAHPLAQLRADPANMHPAKLSRLTACLSALGLSPADASRVAAAPRKPERDDFD